MSVSEWKQRGMEFDYNKQYGILDHTATVSELIASAREFLPPGTPFKILQCGSVRAWYYSPDPVFVPNPERVSVVREVIA